MSDPAQTASTREKLRADRRALHAQALRDGVELFRMVGPVDADNADICLEHVGSVKSVSAWKAIDPQVFSEGLHDQCRHLWRPVRNPNSMTDRETTEIFQNLVKKARAKRAERANGAKE